MNFKDKLQASMTAAVEQGGAETLYGNAFEALMELELDQVSVEEAELNELEVMTSLVEDAETSLHELSETVMASVANGGLSEDAVTVVMASVQAIGRPLGGISIELPSGEAFGQDGGRVEATELAGESIKKRAKEAGAQVTKFVKDMLKKLRELYVTHVSKAGRTLKAAEKLVEKSKKLGGTAKESKIKHALGALKDKDGKKLAINVAKAIPAGLRKYKETIINKAFDELAAALKAADMSKPESVKAVYAACDAVGEACKTSFGLAKALTEEEKKAVKMGEKYESVVGSVWGDGTIVAIGMPKADSKMGPRLAVVGTGAKQKDKEVDVLSTGDVQAYAKAAVEALTVSVEMAKSGQKVGDSAEGVADALAVYEKARKGADLEGEAKEDAKGVAGKVKDVMTIATVGYKAFAKHQQALGVSLYNYSLASAKQYKAEEK